MLVGGITKAKGNRPDSEEMRAKDKQPAVERP